MLNPESASWTYGTVSSPAMAVWEVTMKKSPCVSRTAAVGPQELHRIEQVEDMGCIWNDQTELEA